MKAVVTGLCVFALLAAGASGNDKNIVVQVDRFTGETTVIMKEIGIGTFTDRSHLGQNVELALAATSLSKQPTPRALMVIYSYSANWQFLAGADVHLLVDGERIDLGHFAKMKGNVDGRIVTDTIAAPVGRSVFEKIAGAKSVEMQIGTYETKLKDKAVDRVRAFVAALPVESAVK
jgi:hypothetical protein